MTPEQLAENIRAKRSFLCVGLDPDPAKIPAHLRSQPDPVLSFCHQIIEATAEFAVAFKPNLAFFEALGSAGWDTFRRTVEAIPKDILIIADAKRGDIGNTSSMYAKAFFETLGCDAITVAPYMGRDSVEPFLQYKDKWTFVLGLTSNSGAEDFQWMQEGEDTLYRRVVKRCREWSSGKPGHLGFVVGATRPEYFTEVRALAPQNYFLVPGVGAQGGSLSEVVKANGGPAGLLVNASRSIIYASAGQDFAQAAAKAASEMQQEMISFF